MYSKDEQMIWFPAVGLEGKYMVSNMGDVMHARSGRIVRAYTWLNKGRGKIHYPYFSAVVGGEKKKIYFHQLVARTFIPNPLCLSQINHIDGNKNNNKVSNLEWTTPLENAKHARKIGLNNCIGEGHPASKLKNENIGEIISLFSGGLSCRHIAERFDVSRQCISNIVFHHNWKNESNHLI